MPCPSNQNGTLVSSGDHATQAGQVLDNLTMMLQAAGSDLEHYEGQRVELTAVAVVPPR